MNKSRFMPRIPTDLNITILRDNLSNNQPLFSPVLHAFNRNIALFVFVESVAYGFAWNLIVAIFTHWFYLPTS